MSWQTCPICLGRGVTGFFPPQEKCRVCGGSGIIDEFTGLPPVKYQSASNQLKTEKERDEKSS